MIEDAKSILRTWGSQDPNFLLCNSKLTFQMTMIPEKTQYLTQGPDGVRRLKDGPSINTYRGLKIINSRSVLCVHLWNFAGSPLILYCV